jgi:general stress protein 26
LVRASNPVEHVWDILEGANICMLTTAFDGGLRARPLQLRSDREARVIWFLTDVNSGKVTEVEAEHDVCLVVIDESAKRYLSITARARCVNDRGKATEIWRKTDAMWWEGPDDPDVRLLRVEPLTAELWDGPASQAVAVYQMGKALLTGADPDLGENRRVIVDMR